MKRLIAMIALAAGVLTGLLTGAVTAAHATPTVTAAHATSTVTAAYATPTSRISRAEAVRMAKQYLRSAAFSRKGLIGQLKYEGFSRSDATYGANHSGANWWRQ